MRENWYALCIAILTRYTVEQSIDIINIGKVKNTVITKEDVEDMKALKSYGLTYKEIAEIFNINEHTVYRRIKRANKESLMV